MLNVILLLQLFKLMSEFNQQINSSKFTMQRGGSEIPGNTTHSEDFEVNPEKK